MFVWLLGSRDARILSSPSSLARLASLRFYASAGNDLQQQRQQQQKQHGARLSRTVFLPLTARGNTPLNLDSGPIMYPQWRQRFPVERVHTHTHAHTHIHTQKSESRYRHGSGARRYVSDDRPLERAVDGIHAYITHVVQDMGTLLQRQDCFIYRARETKTNASPILSESSMARMSVVYLVFGVEGWIKYCFCLSHVGWRALKQRLGQLKLVVDQYPLVLHANPVALLSLKNGRSDHA
ncbi:hypothetical protein BD289DRAFT_192123 [Coniella lustricola]|uniref:Uncharacterized protein n=1 Tax=Coniella lustricola TaxID=2025994 RepID=A0A2T3ALT7_9PEZI|nr:hypothetical protein BD289DRAFT_192123 [Coniella lustricola]